MQFFVLLVVVCAVIASAAQYEMEQIHLAQGKTPSEMMVMWVSPTGTSADSVCFVRKGSSTSFAQVEGTSESYEFKDPSEGFADYQSGVLHSCLLEGLDAATKYGM